MTTHGYIESYNDAFTLHRRAKEETPMDSMTTRLQWRGRHDLNKTSSPNSSVSSMSNGSFGFCLDALSTIYDFNGYCTPCKGKTILSYLPATSWDMTLLGWRYGIERGIRTSETHGHKHYYTSWLLFDSLKSLRLNKIYCLKLTYHRCQFQNSSMFTRLQRRGLLKLVWPVIEWLYQVLVSSSYDV